MALTNSQMKDRVLNNVMYAADDTDKTLAAKTGGFVRVLKLHEKVVDAATSTTTTAWALKMDNKVRVTSVQFMPYGSLTASDTDNATLSLEYDDGAGGADTIIASGTTSAAGTGSFTAGTAVSITMHATAANAIVDGTTAAKWLIFKVAKNAAAVVVPAGSLHATVEYI